MRVSKVTVAVLKSTGAYENERAEITVDLSPKDRAEDAILKAKKMAYKAVGKAPSAEEIRKARAVLEVVDDDDCL